MLYTDGPQLMCRYQIPNIPNPCQNNVPIPGMQSHPGQICTRRRIQTTSNRHFYGFIYKILHLFLSKRNISALMIQLLKPSFRKFKMQWLGRNYSKISFSWGKMVRSGLPDFTKIHSYFEFLSSDIWFNLISCWCLVYVTTRGRWAKCGGSGPEEQPASRPWPRNNFP